jgi:hypothetical protein
VNKKKNFVPDEDRTPIRPDRIPVATTASFISYNKHKTFYYAKPQLFESQTATAAAFSDICCLAKQPW